MFTKQGPAQFENRNVSKPNVWLILRIFRWGQVEMLKFNVLVLLSLYTHVIANRLNSKYTRCAVMAEWLTHLTKDVVGGYPVKVSPDPSYKLSTPGC